MITLNISFNKSVPELCGQLWLFKIFFMKVRCYQNKMYNTLSGSVVVGVESESVQMLSICLATPLTPVTQQCQGGRVPHFANVRQCCCFTLNEYHSSKNPTKT